MNISMAASGQITAHWPQPEQGLPLGSGKWTPLLLTLPESTMALRGQMPTQSSHPLQKCLMTLIW